MSVLWIGLFFLSLSWLFLLPLYELPHWTGLVFLALGLVANAFGLRRSHLEPFTRKGALLSLPCVLFAVALPVPYNLGAIVLVLALLGGALVQRKRLVVSISLGIGLGGLILLVQALVWPLYSHLASRVHNTAFLNSVFSFIVNLLGGNARFDGEGLLVQTAQGVKEMNMTWESFGSYVLLNFAIGGALILAFFDKFFDRLTRYLLILIGYALVRSTLLLFAFASLNTSDIFWLRSWHVISFIPLPFILMKWLPLSATEQPLAVPTFTYRRPAAALAGWLLLATICLTGSLLYQDPGVKKPGRILFDESHSDWEWMELAYNTEWYSEKSSYNYYCLGQYLKHYYEVDIKREPITPEYLRQYDVLVLKTPTSPYTPEEIRTIVDYVKAGGGIWLIGDHTNVFGTSTYLNMIAKEFGYSFKYDATYDLTTGNLSFFRPTYQVGHPVISHLPFYLFATSCSLDAPLLSEDVIVGYGLKGVRSDYAQRNFFPKEAHSATAVEHGLLLQSAASKVGKGRVLLYTDSTCFSNFYMFMTGKPELALGSIDWLNRKNGYGFINWLLIGLAVGSVALAIVTRRRAGKHRIARGEIVVIALVAALLGVALSVIGFSKINSALYARPTPHSSYPVVAFEAEHSRYYLPVVTYKAGAPNDIQTFYVWTQRLGLFPEVRFKFKDSLNSDAVVLINPTRKFSEEEIAQFVAYIENGGKALVIDDPKNAGSSTADQLLKPFDLQIDYQGIPWGVVENEQGKAIWTGPSLGIVSGGQPCLYARPLPFPNQLSQVVGPPRVPPAASDGTGTGTATNQPGEQNVSEQKPPSIDEKQPLLAVATRGRGMIAVLGNSTVFTSEMMGSTSTIPDESRRKVYNLEYWIFQDLLKVPVPLHAQLQF